MGRWLAIAFALSLLAPTASAQQANPIMDNYRAYQSALDRDDLASAEAAAAAALEAAEAVSDARATALAQNLAAVRYLRGDAAGAVAPATRAVMLAEQNQANAQSLAMARLLLARIELTTNVSGAADRLAAALQAAQSNRAAANEIYDAAVQLATWSHTNERHDLARLGWSSADQYAEGARFPEAYARAGAKLGYAVSIVQEQARTRRGRAYEADLMQEAYLELNQARRLLTAFAWQDLPSNELTVAQHTFAQVLAWSAVMRSKMGADGTPLPSDPEAQGDADGMSEDLAAPQSLTIPRCMLRPTFARPIEYPSGAANRGELAGAAVRLRINAAGEVEDATIAALVGSEDFAEAINAARWTVQRRPESPANCRMEMNVIWSVAFRLDQPTAPPRSRTRRPN